MQNTNDNKVSFRPFHAFCPIEKAVEGENGEWAVYGPLASETTDYDGDLMDRAGIIKGLDTFQKLGSHVDWEHKYARTKDPDDLIGVGVPFMVEGRPWLKTVLDKSNQLAVKVWNMAKAVPRRHLGYSIFGNGVKNGNRVVTTQIQMVTIAPQPKGFDQFLQTDMPSGAQYAVAKALSGGGSLSSFLSGSCASNLYEIAKALDGPSEETIEGMLPWTEIDGALWKAFTTGSGSVMPGDTGGGALRGQFMAGITDASSSLDTNDKDCCKCAKETPCICGKRSAPAAAKVSTEKAVSPVLIEALRKAGAKNPDAIAALVRKA